MNEVEARSLIDEQLAAYRLRTYAELAPQVGDTVAFEKVAPSGIEYAVEIMLVWDNLEGGNIRVMVAVDDMRWPAWFHPMSDDFILAPDGSFVGERLYRGADKPALMARYTLYAYVDGSDLDEVATEIETALEALIASTTWAFARPTIVNQKHERDDSYGPEDLTGWDLGLNLDLPDPGGEPAGWFQDVEQVARLVGQVVARTGRQFVIGIGDGGTGLTEDLFFVEDGEPDLAELRAVVGVEAQR